MDEKQSGLKKITSIIYVLYGAGALFFPLVIAAIIMNYIKKEDTVGTIYESHFKWQMRTFWFGLLFSVIGGITSIFLIGIPILIATAIWLLYRVIKGFLRLSDNKEMI